MTNWQVGYAMPDRRSLRRVVGHCMTDLRLLRMTIQQIYFCKFALRLACKPFYESLSRTHPPLRAVDTARIAPAARIVCMHVGNRFLRKEMRQRGFEIGTFDHFRIDDQIVAVVSAQRKQAYAQLLRDNVYGAECFGGILPDKDRA